MSGYHTRLHWCNKKTCLNSDLTSEIKRWLFDKGSLTERLIQHSENHFRVEVLSLKKTTPTPDEIKALGLRPRSQAFVRQVLLYSHNRPVVYARTVIPHASLRSALRGLVLLGNKPLGAVLFADRSMRRKEMEVTKLSQSHVCYRWTQYKGMKPIWGRRSVFILKKKQLLVSEFFLPELFE